MKRKEEKIIEEIRRGYGRTAYLEKPTEWMDWVYLGEDGTMARRRVWVFKRGRQMIAKFEQYGMTPEEEYEKRIEEGNIKEIIKEIKEYLRGEADEDRNI